MEKSIGVICNRRLTTRVTGKVYSSVVRPAMVYRLETVAFTKKKVKEMEVCRLKNVEVCYGSDEKR